MNIPRVLKSQISVYFDVVAPTERDADGSSYVLVKGMKPPFYTGHQEKWTERLCKSLITPMQIQLAYWK
jgi:hypothetical protein